VAKKVSDKVAQRLAKMAQEETAYQRWSKRTDDVMPPSSLVFKAGYREGLRAAIAAEKARGGK